MTKVILVMIQNRKQLRKLIMNATKDNWQVEQVNNNFKIRLYN